MSKEAPDFCYPPPAEKLQNFFGVFLQFQTGVDSILSSSDYTAQSTDISNKITELRIERRKKLSEDEDDELLDELKNLDGILKDAEINDDFDNELFEQIVTSITVKSNAELTFKLLGGIELTEEIYEKGRCKSA